MMQHMLRSTTAPSAFDAPHDEADDEPAETYIGNRIADDDDVRTGPDEVERLADQILRAERRLRMIEELSERSMALARLAHDRAMDDGRRAAEAAGEPERPAATADDGAPPAAPNPDASAATYAKLSRTVRLCLDMEARADETLRALQDGAPAVRAARETRLDREARAHRQEVELEVLAMMEPVIREAADSEAREREIFAAIVERMTFGGAYARPTTPLQAAGQTA